MQTKASLLCLLLAMVATGCGYHGQTPRAQAPESFSVDTTANPVKNLPDHPWWQEMGSRELDRLVLEALENNQQISIAAKNIEVAQSVLETVRLGWLPSVNLMAGRFNSDGVVLLQNLPVPLAGSGNIFAFLPTWVANIIQLPNQTKSAEKKVDATAADYLTLRTTIAAQVVTSYALLLASIEQERLLVALQENLRTQFSTTESMRARGLQNQIAVIEQDSDLQQLLGQLALNRSNQIAAKNALLTLLGRPLASFTPQNKFADLNLDVITPGNTPTSVLATRPDVVAARAKIDAADYGISATASLFAPDLMLSAASVRATGNAAGERFSAQETVEIGLLSVALDPQFIGKISTANKQYDAAVLNYLKVVDQAIKEADNALADFEARRTALTKAEKALANQKTNLATYRAMVHNGLLAQTQYLQNLTELDLATIAIIQSKLQAVNSLATLYQSMGAGATFGQDQYRLADQSIGDSNRDDTKN
ncbi:MAG: TolC family protein [Burkholderiaceae bacterium]|nr:TolC family protein [Burkholderiaceae bacterium]MCD8517772.1 TolC family protein [Burkholderiaceae bacterium]